MTSLTFIYCTNRDHPKLEWFLDSLLREWKTGDHFTILVILPRLKAFTDYTSSIGDKATVKIIQMKPSVWAGEHRLTREDWWCKASMLNTGLCLTRTDWVSFIDDRSALMPGYVDHIRIAMAAREPYVLIGSYEKRHSLKVENGVITHSGIVTGEDGRVKHCQKYWAPLGHKPPFPCGGEWAYGCSVTLPLEWALEVNGVFEKCDSLSGEDYAFGLMLQNAGKPIRFEPRMQMVEDRTPSECGPVARRTDKGVSPNDKSHKLLDEIKPLKYAPNPFSIRELRRDILAGKPWPKATEPTHDWWDGQPISEF